MPATIVLRTTAFATSPGTTWAALQSDGAFDVVIAAATGDVIEVGLSLQGPTSGRYSYLDVATMVSGSPVNWISTGSGSHVDGIAAALNPTTQSGDGVNASTTYTVQAGDISGGNVTLRLYGKTSASTSTWVASSSLPAMFYATTRYPPSSTALTSPTATASASATAATLALSALLLTSPTAGATADASPGTLAFGALSLTSPTASATASAEPGTVTFGTLSLTSPTATATAEAEPGLLTSGGLLLTSPTATATAGADPADLTFGALELTSPVADAVAAATPGVLVSETGLALTSPKATAMAAAVPAELDGVEDLPGAWTADLTGRALIGVTTTTTELHVPPVPMEIPAGVSVVTLTRESHQLPVLTEGTPTDVAYTIATGTVGVPHVWVDGVDRSYDLDGDLFDIDDLVSEIGHGDRSATGDIKRMQTWDKKGVGDWAWLRPAAKVEVGVVNGTERHVWWAGDLMSHKPRSTSRDGGGTYEVSCTLQGTLLQAMQANMQPLDRMDETDIGIVIPRVLNAIESKRFPDIPTMVTGVTTRKRGSYGQKVGDYVRSLLATAWDGDSQLQLVRAEGDPRQYRLAWTDTTTQHWTLTAGAHGVTAELELDWTQVTNVLFGRGSLPNGHHWMNRKFPYLLPYDPPTYFSGDTSDELLLGTTDADTINDGVTLMQQRMWDIGYRGFTINGVYDSAFQAAVRRLQYDRGLTVDGRTGGQTWTSVWSIGATGANLTSVRRPLAWDPRVEKYLYLPNGARAELNPAYVPGWPRLEDDLDYGDNTSLRQGIADARQRIERLKEPAWVGTITLETDPWEGSRYYIQPIQNVLLKGYDGQDVFLHIASRRINRKAGTVTLTVDSAFRDALTIKQILDRDAESKPDPARRPGAIGRTRATSAPDMVTPFDGESPAGILPELTLRGGLWSVWPLAIDQVGTLAKAWARTWDPVSEFAMLVFGAEVFPNMLRAGIGNPLTRSKPWQETEVDAFLTAHGFIDGWGHLGDACGYAPKTKSDGGSVTGLFRVANPVNYVSEMPPFVWVAMIPALDCRIRGEFDPQPVT